MKKLVIMLMCISLAIFSFGCSKNEISSLSSVRAATSHENGISSISSSIVEVKGSKNGSSSAADSSSASSKQEVKQIEKYDLTYATTKNVKDVLNLRSQPNTNSKVLAKIGSGSVFYITGKMSNNWYKVNFNNTEGYVSGDYAIFNPLSMYINTQTTLDGNTVDVGTEVKVVSKRNNDCNISYNNQVFTVKSDILSTDMPDIALEKYNKTFLTSFSTNYSTVSAQHNRNNNMEIAAKTINGKVIAKDGIFDWNKIVGQTTKEKGYKLAPVIANGKTAYDYGGGICQVSSTLYNVALNSNFKIIERHPHSHVMAYMKGKPDATIAYPTLNLVFKNTLNTPVLISAYAKDGTIKITFYTLTSK